MYFLKISLAKAVALAKLGQGQAVCGGFGLAHDFSGPKPLQAKPKPGLLGQAGPGKSLPLPVLKINTNQYMLVFWMPVQFLAIWV